MSSDSDSSNDYETVTFSGSNQQPDPSNSEYAEISELARSRSQGETAPALPPARKMPAKRQASLGALSLPTKPFRPLVRKLPRPASVDVTGLRSMEEGVPMTLSDFVRTHSKNFPLRVSIEKGFCTSVEEAAISAGDTYNIHFMKYTKVVYVTRQDDDHEVYTIPMNSAVQVGLVYDPHGDLEQAMRGYQFDTVAEIVAMATLPKIIRATRAYKGNNATSSVDENEILIISKVAKAKFMGSTQLKAYSLTRRERKSLHLQCAGSFTTHPSSICLYLPQLLQSVSDLFPSKAKLFFDTVAYEDLLEELPTEVVSLTHSSIETSLITTLYSEDSDQCNNDDDDDDDLSTDEVDMFDIPVNLDIDITILPLFENKKADLCEKTRTLFEKFDPTLPKICRPATSSHVFATQSLLFKAARDGHKKDGVQIEPPLNAFRSLPLSGSTLPAHYEELPLDKAGPPLPPKSFPLAPSDRNQQVSSSSPELVHYEDVHAVPPKVPSRTASDNGADPSLSHSSSKNDSLSSSDPLQLDTDDEDNSDSVSKKEKALPAHLVEPYMVPLPRTRLPQVGNSSTLDRRPPLPTPGDSPALPPPRSSSQSPPPLSLPSSAPPLPPPPLASSSPAAPPTPTSPTPTPSPSSPFPLTSRSPNDPLPSLDEINESSIDVEYEAVDQKPPLCPKPKLPTPKSSPPPPVAASNGVKLRRHHKDTASDGPTRSPRPQSCPPRPRALSEDDPLFDENGYMKLHSAPHAQHGRPFTVNFGSGKTAQSGSKGDHASGTGAKEGNKTLQDERAPLSGEVPMIQALEARVAALEATVSTSAEQISSLVAEMARFVPSIKSLMQKQEKMEKELEHLDL